MATNFREKVLNTVRGIKRGQTMTYGEVAAQAGNAKAARAVGAIMRTNYNPAIPCHRVIGKNSCGSYNRGGAKKKINILRAEGVTFV